MRKQWFIFFLYLSDQYTAPYFSPTNRILVVPYIPPSIQLGRPPYHVSQLVRALLAYAVTISIYSILQELKMIDFNFIFSFLIDNNSTIVISKDKKITHNTHHIEICYHHIQDLIEKDIIDITHILLTQMAADSFTKPLDAVKFGEFCDLIDIEDCEWKSGAASTLAMRKTLYNGYFTPNLAGIVLEYTANFVYRFQPLSHAPDE